MRTEWRGQREPVNPVRSMAMIRSGRRWWRARSEPRTARKYSNRSDRDGLKGAVYTRLTRGAAGPDQAASNL
ncbi:hypothetical protein GCM10010201_36100 [Pilimelia columellifera subsp. columellifera]|uniref:Uncharacterized protein n=1 Tax=Pilimelia columellifera subsp. columellifera TaxID=706583 RepID=A0ABN3NU32_9ACTN